jgi:hypothetical protein
VFVGREEFIDERSGCIATCAGESGQSPFQHGAGATRHPIAKAGQPDRREPAPRAQRVHRGEQIRRGIEYGSVEVEQYRVARPAAHVDLRAAIR